MVRPMLMDAVAAGLHHIRRAARQVHPPALEDAVVLRAHVLQELPREHEEAAVDSPGGDEGLLRELLEGLQGGILKPTCVLRLPVSTTRGQLSRYGCGMVTGGRHGISPN